MANPTIVPIKSPLTRVLQLLPERVQAAFAGIEEDVRLNVQEIRLCQDKPLMVCTDDGDSFVTLEGCSGDPHEAVWVGADMVGEVLDAVTVSSVYALEEAMREGYLPLPGGHRVGLLGELRVEADRILGFRHVTGFNVRINRPVPGASLRVLKFLLKPGGTIWSTLIVSAPGCGKTTLLRDLIRVLSCGHSRYGLRPHRVGVADERCEIAGSYRGVPQNDLGPRADVIDMCPKRHALSMLVRAMSPDIVATDEIGHPDDAAAILDAVGAGVTLLCTAHGTSLAELEVRPSIRPLLRCGLFRRVVVLSRREGAGTVERVIESGESG